jgi:hypothetical protein
MSTIASRGGADLSWSSSHPGLTRQPSLLVVVAEPQVAAARELSVSASGKPGVGRTPFAGDLASL